jgi:hypothetical protein
MLSHSKESIDSAIEFKAEKKVLEKRVSGRLTHASGRTYHPELNPPEVSGRDDVSFYF